VFTIPRYLEIFSFYRLQISPFRCLVILLAMLRILHFITFPYLYFCYHCLYMRLLKISFRHLPYIRSILWSTSVSHFNCTFRLLKTDTPLSFMQILSLRTLVLSITGTNQQMLFSERIAYCKYHMKIIRVGAKIYNFLPPSNLLYTSSVHFFWGGAISPAHFQKKIHSTCF
jgi:hypothetical protein